MRVRARTKKHALTGAGQFIPIIGTSALVVSYLLMIWIVMDSVFGSGAVLVSTVSVGGFAEEVADIVALLTTLPFVVITTKRLWFAPLPGEPTSPPEENAP